MNDVGKPCAGEPHARFDGRGLETGHLRHRASPRPSRSHTEAFRQGADAHAIMRQTGHRSPVMLEVYAREHAPLVGNAVTRLGL